MRIYLCITVMLTVLIGSLNPSFAFSIPGEAGSCPDVPKDHDDDVKCFRYAANRGDRYAQNNLGFILAEGRGVPVNLIEAYAWWTVAAMNGIETARGNLDRIREKMTPAQVEKAQFLAMSCFMRIDK